MTPAGGLRGTDSEPRGGDAAPIPELERGHGEFQLTVAGRACTVRFTRALVSWVDEQRYLGSDEPRQYGLVLWPASIALALEIGHRAAEFRGRRVLELGAGVGLAGIAAAAVGASVVQTDRDAEALALCGENAERNDVITERRLADWTAWPAPAKHDWLIGADILYRTSLHDQLRAILDASCAAGARVLVADPMRPATLKLLERMEQEGWHVGLTRWSIGEGVAGRVIGVFELARRSA